MNNHNQVMPEECIHGVVNWVSMLRHSCLIGKRKKVRDARETNWRHEAKAGEDNTGHACGCGNHATPFY